jgi:hypothetical protein
LKLNPRGLSSRDEWRNVVKKIRETLASLMPVRHSRTDVSGLRDPAVAGFVSDGGSGEPNVPIFNVNTCAECLT